MNWMLILLPSGADTTCSVRMLSPADGATVSSSKVSSIAAVAAACLVPDSLFAAASMSARLATSPVAAKKSRPPNTALIRGSMRGSSTSFEAICIYLGISLFCVLLGAVAGQDRFGNFDDVLWSKAQLTHHDFPRR